MARVSGLRGHGPDPDHPLRVSADSGVAEHGRCDSRTAREAPNLASQMRTGDLPAGLARNRPQAHHAALRSVTRLCQVHTAGFALPDLRMISAVPQPSAVVR